MVGEAVQLGILRVAQQEESMTYPFSIRESVNVIKHLNSFPDDGIENAIENVISFDRLDKHYRNI